MDENIQQQILDELKELNKNLSANGIDSMKHPKPNFAEFLIGSINSINKTLFTLTQQLGSLIQQLEKK
jgi:hypothetical protein